MRLHWLGLRLQGRHLWHGGRSNTSFEVLVALLTTLVAPPVEGQTHGVLEGVVRVAQPPSPWPAAVVRRQQGVCGEAVADDSLVIGPGGVLGGVVAWIEGLPRPEGFQPPGVELDQYRCRFVPRVLSATVGANVTFASRDSILHTAHAYLGASRTLFNIALPVRGMVVRKRLTQRGRIQFRCDVGHTWMAAFLFVFDHAYHDVSSVAGVFRIAHVPEGAHRVHLWHERLGERTMNVTIAPNRVTRLELTL